MTVFDTLASLLAQILEWTQFLNILVELLRVFGVAV